MKIVTRNEFDFGLFICNNVTFYGFYAFFSVSQFQIKPQMNVNYIFLAPSKIRKCTRNHPKFILYSIY